MTHFYLYYTYYLTVIASLIKVEYFQPYFNHRQVGVSHLRALQKMNYLKSIQLEMHPLIVRTKVQL